LYSLLITSILKNIEVKVKKTWEKKYRWKAALPFSNKKLKKKKIAKLWIISRQNFLESKMMLL